MSAHLKSLRAVVRDALRALKRSRLRDRHTKTGRRKGTRNSLILVVREGLEPSTSAL
jgi:hypothetical protein